MDQSDTRAALSVLLAASIRHCESEIAQMNRSVRLLEKVERARITDAYHEGQWWRGLATDDFARMVDALVVLTEGGIEFAS